MNSEGGLYLNQRPRNPNLIWGEGGTVELNVGDFPHTISNTDVGDETSDIGSPIHSCSFVDPSFWRRAVENAPVNKRAWVLQERLMASRIIHFCEDQIAWECCELDAAECAPHGTSRLELHHGLPQLRRRLKDWKYLYSEPDLKEEHRCAAYDDWLNMVRHCNTLALTRESDRLAVLAGIASVMSAHIGSEYVAGLWRRRLASQLLWYIQPDFESGSFSQASRRVWTTAARAEYSVPSFSWAAISASPNLVFGQALDDDRLLITIQEIKVNLQNESRPFVPPKPGGHILLDCQMLQISIYEKRRRNSGAIGADVFSWRLKKPSMSGQRLGKLQPLVYLDSPQDDLADVTEGRSEIFFVPAYKCEEYGLIGPLLQGINTGEMPWFNRVGLSRFPAYDPALDVLFEMDGSLRDATREEIRLY